MNKMNTKKDRLKEIEREVERLLNEMELIKSKSIDLDSKLLDFPDFPVKVISKFGAPEERIETINDLINSSPEELLKKRGVGPKKLDQIQKWMESKRISFL